MTKQELEARENMLEKKLKKVREMLFDFDYKEKEAKFGKEFTCEFCKFNAVNDLSADGWHNTCGADNCTCCHNVCEKYEPDNDITLFIKQHIRECSPLFRSDHTNGYGHINNKEYQSIKHLIGDIFKPFGKNEKMIELLKICFDTQIKKSEERK